jgi:hypothetical protein
MTRARFLAPLGLAVLVGLGTGVAACGPTGPEGTQHLVSPSSDASPADASPAVSESPERTLIAPTVKPGSTERPILTLEPPQPVVP